MKIRKRAEVQKNVDENFEARAALKEKRDKLAVSRSKKKGFKKAEGKTTAVTKIKTNRKMKRTVGCFVLPRTMGKSRKGDDEDDEMK
mmetsp:Transcript_42500/g.51590  ORF Transcript_42500/g.51590 Transcript_42500/m.51590 type:complete len:87 (+) Transcript_42500:80-340(+)